MTHSRYSADNRQYNIYISELPCEAVFSFIYQCVTAVWVCGRKSIIGNHKLNVYLKAIRDLCVIDKPIFSHVARHTYATRCLNRGIRLEVVAKLLGHSTTRITQHYAKLLKDNILNEVKDAFEKSH